MIYEEMLRISPKVFLAVFVFTLIAWPVQAQAEMAPTEVVEPTRTGRGPTVRPQRPTRQPQLELLQEARTQRQDRLEALREQGVVRRAELQAKRDEARQQALEKREEFKVRLQAIKDMRKQRVVERIAARMDKVQENWIEKLNNHLDRLEELLAKIRARAQLAKENGQDISVVEAAIVRAEGGITTARAAITNLAGQTYVVEITDEESLGQDVSTTVHALQGDLQAVHQAVKDARVLVVEVLRLLKTVPAVDEATATGE